jgi:hypothetical protein
MDVCLVIVVLSGRGLCEELITRPEESYRLWCVDVCSKKITLVKEDEGQDPLRGYRTKRKKNLKEGIKEKLGVDRRVILDCICKS